jgi:hypothetical protein
MLGLYAAAQGLPADSFGLGTLPHLRLTRLHGLLGSYRSDGTR